MNLKKKAKRNEKMIGENEMASEFRNPMYKSPRKPCKMTVKQQSLVMNHELDETDLSKIEHFFEMHSAAGKFPVANLRVFCENFAAFGENDDEESIQRRVAVAREIFKTNDSNNHEALNYDQFVKFAKQFIQ
jgi:hypothetical protein